MIKDTQSLSSRRAWIEIHNELPKVLQSYCRSPHGERGLKSLLSHVPSLLVQRRSPHGERGLKLSVQAVQGQVLGRSPHGERGLKFDCCISVGTVIASLSSRRAWIEIESL